MHVAQYIFPDLCIHITLETKSSNDTSRSSMQTLSRFISAKSYQDLYPDLMAIVNFYRNDRIYC